MLFSAHDPNAPSGVDVYRQGLDSTGLGVDGEFHRWLVDADRGLPYREVDYQNLDLAFTGSGSGRVVSDPAGLDCSSDCQVGFQHGQQIALNPTPGTGSTFAGWSGACSGAAQCNLTMSQARTVTARFNRITTHRLAVARSGNGTVRSSPAGILCGNTCTSEFMAGTNVVLTATPGDGTRFVDWGGACSGSGDCAITMRADGEVQARFETASGAVELRNGVPIGPLSGATASERFYFVNVPSGARDLVLTLRGNPGNTGDADLYVRRDRPPTLDTYDCRGFSATNDETCRFAAPTAGTYHVMIRGYRAYSGVMLEARYDRSDQAARVQQMYIAYYGRPGDPGGVDYWAERLAGAGGNWIADIVNAFGTSAEYTQRFGQLGPAALIDNLYQQLFNRTADPAGRTFYVDLLRGTNASGHNPTGRRSTLAQLALDIANGAQQQDRTILEHKIEVAAYFTDRLRSSGRRYQTADIPDAVQLMSRVGASRQSVENALGQVDAFIASTP